ncbi:tetratricopeptide repeat protein [Oecophyllibacter saccharovorans]|uniref:tetratricopeptide repeat protein n=1 Tax=Oecophyllibacter saccharovorans TaxID=2558360 RepID=UPI001172F2C9|nr:tetratricopeptide repeat protein [Oecophyllibacter saccharovorans]TPW36405.1 sel1 repeat family protein [Oecophyllibacter saccharovorans]
MILQLPSLRTAFPTGLLKRLRPKKKPARPTSRQADWPAELQEIYARALKGHTLQQVLWGKALLDSIWMPPDPQQAREWFLIAAQAGEGAAHNMLGRCAHFGWGDKRDLAQARQHYENAARLGDLWGYYNLGICVLRGLGGAEDRNQAFRLFRHAALRGHAKSMNLLARFMEEGWETPRNPQAALEWYRRAATGGDYRGQHNYATALLAMNCGEEALFWWRQAVEEATPDILLAMQRSFSKPGAPQDPGLQCRVAQRLSNLAVAPAPAC